MRKVLLLSGAAFAGGVALLHPPSTTAATVAPPRPQTTQISGSASGSALLQVLNTTAGGGAIIGQVGPTQYSAAAATGLYGIFDASSGTGNGVLGFATNGTGVVAETFGGAYSAIYAQNYSSAAEPAIQGVSNGNSIVGTSADSNSIVGITQNPSNSIQAAGVFGEDASTASPDENYGVIGTSTTNGGGVLGTAAGGIGVEGASSTNYGVYGVSSSADGGHFVSSAPNEYSGVAGLSTNGYGVYGWNMNAGSTPAPEPYDDVGTAGYSTQGTGVYGYSNKNNGGWFENDANTNCCGGGSGGAKGVYGGPYALYAQADSSIGFPLGAFNRDTGDGFLVNAEGSIFLSGSVNASYTGFSQTRNPNTDVATYSAQQTEATVEDLGTAQLVNGAASVALASDFRQTIDGSSTYMVFLTPHGDGALYVATTGPAAFVVREVGSGRATFAFDYRIVARPYGSRLARLPPHPEFARMFGPRGSVSHAELERVAREENAERATSERALRLAARGSHVRFAVNHIPAGPPPSARALSQQFRLH